MVMVYQEAQCPKCRSSWELKPNEFVSVGDSVACRNGCGPFTATSDTITCCMEDAHGMVETALRGA